MTVLLEYIATTALLEYLDLFLARALDNTFRVALLLWLLHAQVSRAGSRAGSRAHW